MKDINPEFGGVEEKPQWFCLRSKPKCEHIAAGHLRATLGLEVFAPQIRYRRVQQQRAVWVTEPLFPSYLFAKYRLRESYRSVQSTQGVKGGVHFGGRWPAVPEETMEELRSLYGQETVHVIDPQPQTGDEVALVGGPFHGLSVLVKQVVPARERVCVLLEILGRETILEVGYDQVIKESARL